MDGVLGYVLNRLRMSNHWENNSENRQENQGTLVGVKKKRTVYHEKRSKGR
jgi:hypothetical protein